MLKIVRKSKINYKNFGVKEIHIFLDSMKIVRNEEFAKDYG